jgi:hypothetical protein
MDKGRFGDYALLRVPYFPVSSSFQKQKPAKHPKRPRKAVDVKTMALTRQKMLKHLKVGKLYKLTMSSKLPGYMVPYLYKGPAIGERLFAVEPGKWVIYLGSEVSGHGLFLKVVYEDVAGWSEVTQGVLLKRMTKRQRQ